jgi:hypothetical protein
MPEYSLTEIDSTTDWLVCETVLTEQLKSKTTTKNWLFAL